MNLLIDTLPSALTIGNTEYGINSDFRSCLRIMLAYEDDDLTPQEKQIILLSNFYREIPTDTVEAFREANRFLNGGKDSEEEDKQPRLFSWSHDQNFIYAAFRQTHGIDLTTASLHWWQFLALFMDLGSETTFCQLVSLRKRVKSGKATKEERATAREMGAMFEVPEADTRTLDEKLEEARAEAEFQRLIAGNNG